MEKYREGFVKVKEWFVDKTNSASQNYCITLCEYGSYTLSHSVVLRVDKVLAETEKAIHVTLEGKDLGGGYKGWNTWVPKSVIVATNLIKIETI